MSLLSDVLQPPSIVAVDGAQTVSDKTLVNTIIAPGVGTAVGELNWNSADNVQTLDLVMAGGAVVQQIGEEFYYRIKAGVAITNGQVVMNTGTQGASGAIIGAPATGVLFTDSHTILGVATEDIALNGWGYVTEFGVVRGIDTTGTAVSETWVDGDVLYYNPAIVGTMTKVVPIAPNPKTKVATVIYAAANGSIVVRLSHSFSLENLADVESTTPGNDDLLQYVTNKWQHIPAANINVGSATVLETGRTISLTGDVTGTSGTFNGSGNISFATTIAANSVALGTDTTGNYVGSMTAGTGITVGTATGEGSTPVITNTAPNVTTNLSTTTTATTLTVVSSDGTNALLPAATTTVAGVLTGADKTKLDGIATGATTNTGTVTSVGNGNGMNFTTFTTTGTVALGTPSTLTAATTNALTASSHTHAITGFATGTGTASGTNTGDNPGVTSVATAGTVSGLTLTGGTITTTGTITLGGAITGFATDTHNHTLDSLSNTTITTNTAGEILKWGGAAWINNTLAEAGIQPAGTYATGTGTASGTNTGDNAVNSLYSGLVSNVTTNLSTTTAATTITINSSDGTNATIPAATTTVAGVLTGADKLKLDGIAAGATNVTNNNQLTNGAGYITSYVDTTYSAGTGITLTSTTFSVVGGTGITADAGGVSLTDITSGSATVGTLAYSGITNTAGKLYGGTVTPTGVTRLNYSGYFYPTYINLLGSPDTATVATHYFVETGTDGYVRPKTLANVKTEIVTTAAVNAAALTTTGTVTSGTWSGLFGAVSGANLTTLNASNLSSGTVADARLTGTYTGFTHKIDGSNTLYTSPNTGSTSPLGRTVYGLAEYRSAGSAQIGALVFIAPNTLSSIMHQLEIKGMLYNQSIVHMTVQGYRTTAAWTANFKISTGTVDIQARWGVTPTGNNCLILGDVATSWSYPHISIIRAMFSHSSVADSYCSGWTVAVVTDLSLYTNVSATLTDSSMVGSITGSAATLTTARTIGMSGVTATATSFNGSANITIPVTAVPATLLTGTIADARISGSYTGMTNLTGTGNVDFAKFLGLAADLVSAPSFTWTGDLTTGFYRPAASQVAVAIAGVQRALITATGITATNLSGTNTGDNPGVTSVATAGTVSGLTLTGGTITTTGTITLGGAITGFATDTHNHTLDSLSNTTITTNAAGEILKWSGTAWINNTLAEAGIQPAGTYATGTGTASGTNTGDNAVNSLYSGLVSNVTTNLSTTTAATTVTINSSDGTNATIPAATTTVAGVLTGADKLKLDGIAAGATTNTGTVTSVATSGGYGGLTLTGGTITTTGTITMGGTPTGTWPISISGDAATAGGLAVGTGVNSTANEIVRTNASGYCDFGWINTVSGTATGTLTRVYCSQDAYLRYLSPAAFLTSIGVAAGATANTGTVTSVGNGNGMNFTTFTTSGTVTLGTPSSCTDLTTNAVTASSHTHAITGFVAESGDTMTGNLIWGTADRDNSPMGTYDALKTQQIWSMGAAYVNNAAGTNFGTLYGAAYKHTNNTTGGTMAGGHQMVWCQAGTGTSAIGTDIWTSGNVTAYSDIRVKKNIVRIPDALNKVCQLSGYTFERTDGTPLEDGSNSVPLRQTGVIAQEVLKVLPEAVTGTEETHYSVAYGNMVGLLIEAIKEQQAIIDTQEARISRLEALINKIV